MAQFATGMCRAGVVGFSGLVSGQALAVDQHPNIVLIVADDLGYGDVSIQGAAEFSTPHLDSIARQGIRFTDGYVSASLCSPSRAGFLTGRYQERFGHEVLFWNNNNNVGLPVGEVTIADRLKDAGYITGMVGKWHLGKEKPFFPITRGFMEFFGDPGHGSPYLPDPQTGKVGGPQNKFYRNEEQVTITNYVTDVYGREAVDFIQRHKSDPFFLYVAFTAPHHPLQATDEYLSRVSNIRNPKRRTYAAMVLAMDDWVGRILNELADCGLEDNTMVAFLSDNGSLGPPEGDNGPLRERKGRVLEGGIRVPFFIKWPGVFPAGKTVEFPVISLDLAPTFFEAAGISVQPEWDLDGVNLIPFLTGKNPDVPHDRLFWRYWRTGPNKQLCAVREGEWKLVTPSTPGRFGETPGEQQWRLYRLSDDPGETQDLSGQYPEKAQQLKQRWHEWNATLKDPLWYFDPPGSEHK